MVIIERKVGESLLLNQNGEVEIKLLPPHSKNGQVFQRIAIASSDEFRVYRKEKCCTSKNLAENIDSFLRSSNSCIHRFSHSISS